MASASAAPTAPVSSLDPSLEQIGSPPVEVPERGDPATDLNAEEEDLWEDLLRGSTLPAVQSPTGSSSPATSPLGPRSSPSPVDVSTESFVPTRLQELMYEVEFEWPSDSEVNDRSTSNVDAGDQEGSEESAELAPGTGLFNDSDEEEADRPRRSRLRRGDETSHWYHPLPEPPVMHPSTKRRNHYVPKPDWDYDVSSEIVRLLDVQGEIPHRCYLVPWKGRPLQMSSVWMERLDNPSCRPMMQQVDEWKASGDDLPFTAWAGERDSASEAGTCFMDALRSALYYLGQSNLVTMAMWDAFEDTRPSAIKYRVSREDVSEFFKLLQRQSIPLDYDHLHRNILSTSSGNVSTLHDFCQNLAPGAYLVSAGQDGVGHCFVVVSRGPGKRLLALDQYDEEKDPPVTVLPLSNQQWIQHVKWVTRVEMKHGYKCRHGKRMSKTQRKRQKRLKMQEQQQ